MTAELMLLLIVIVVALFTFQGYKQGFLRIIFSFVSILLAIWLVVRISPMISDYLMEKTKISTITEKKIMELFEDKNSERDNTIYENQIETIQSYTLPDLLKGMLVKNDTPEVYTKLLVTAFEEYVARFLSKLFIKILVFVISLLLVYVILKITVLSLDFIGKIPVINGLNRMAGALIGLSEGFMVIWLFLLIMTLFAGSVAGQKFFEMVNGNKVLSLFYSTDVFINLMDR